jgi:hypothetical protein
MIDPEIAHPLRMNIAANSGARPRNRLLERIRNCNFGEVPGTSIIACKGRWEDRMPCSIPLTGIDQWANPSGEQIAYRMIRP